MGLAITDLVAASELAGSDTGACEARTMPEVMIDTMISRPGDRAKLSVLR